MLRTNIFDRNTTLLPLMQGYLINVGCDLFNGTRKESVFSGIYNNVEFHIAVITSALPRGNNRRK